MKNKYLQRDEREVLQLGCSQDQDKFDHVSNFKLIDAGMEKIRQQSEVSKK